MITLRMACGHVLKTDDMGTEQPICVECGERRVSHVKTRAPKFRGVCTGPLARYEALQGIPVTMPKGSHE
jgi:hypothetical protein